MPPRSATEMREPGKRTDRSSSLTRQRARYLSRSSEQPSLAKPRRPLSRWTSRSGRSELVSGRITNAHNRPRRAPIPCQKSQALVAVAGAGNAPVGAMRNMTNRTPLTSETALAGPPLRALSNCLKEQMPWGWQAAAPDGKRPRPAGTLTRSHTRQRKEQRTPAPSRRVCSPFVTGALVSARTSAAVCTTLVAQSC